MITKKWFVKIAGVLKRIRSWRTGPQAADHAADELADMFTANNPRFDRGRFLKAAAARDISQPIAPIRGFYDD